MATDEDPATVLERSPLSYERLTPDEMETRAKAFAELTRTRRTVRHFLPEPLPAAVVDACVDAAAQAPSGANKQPWTFVVVEDGNIKRRIREAAEEVERAFYAGGASERWLADLAPLGVGPDKPFLEEAPTLIVVFAHRRGREGEQHYYVSESVGIAVGVLLTALHNAGIATLTHTPAPMKFLVTGAGAPSHEQPYMIVVAGYPTTDCQVPRIERKPLSEVLLRR